MNRNMSTIVTGVIGSDAHVVGVTILEHALKEHGFAVKNLGAQTPAEEFVVTARQHDADAILVSSMNGHAKQNCRGLHLELNQHSINPVTLIGGNLAVGQTTVEDVREEFKQMGFDHVLTSGATPQKAIDILQRELKNPISGHSGGKTVQRMSSHGD